MYPVEMFDQMQGDQRWFQWNEHTPAMKTDKFSWVFTEDHDLLSWGMDNFFPGIYAYHWHNRWDVDVRNSSFFGAFQRLNAVCNVDSSTLMKNIEK